MEMLEINDLQIPIEFRRSERAKRFSMTMDKDLTLRVTIPRRGSERMARAFVQEKSRWIYRMRHQLYRKQRAVDAFRSQVFFLGKVYEIQVRDVADGSSEITFCENKLIIRALNCEEKLAQSMLKRFFQAEARKVILNSLSEYASRYGFEYRQVTIRDQKTRWGSCSSDGNLNFSYRLVMAPLEVVDYVVIHELCHLKEMNHSKRFWNLVAKECPGHKVCKKWLKEHGHLLESVEKASSTALKTKF